MKHFILLMFFLFCSLPANAQSAFDHSHTEFTALLKKHVAWNETNTTTNVDYAGFKKDHAALKSYTKKLSDIKEAEFKTWSVNEQRAFLINAYNAYTVELIVSKYPNLKSIKDLGSLLSSPWSKPFFNLLGQKRSLDDVEHKLLRGAKNFNEPRIHFAVNCASIGCPALRHEAFKASTLEAQLEEQTKRFLSDRTRNRFDKSEDVMFLSSIFDWYGADFSKGPNAKNLSEFLSRYAGTLGLSNGEKMRLQKSGIDIEFLDYDWSLNSKK
jgi:Protein of unknown function, DUF547